MRSYQSVALALAAVVSLSACSGSETAPTDPPVAATETVPAATPVAPAPSFDTIPVDQAAQPPVPAPANTPASASEPQQQPVGFRVPADAIGGQNMSTTTFDVATRGESALQKHFTDSGLDPSTFYFKLPVEQRDGYWTMTFYGNPPTQPDGMYIEVRVFPDGSAEVMR